ncbi:MAG TPA: periplasmic heavy metal sensor [Phenylobacterium sp.]|nr:periplasmic heavy metal sensor [Phenylobacterium sp.]
MSARGLAIALFASVALNLFVIGAVVGGFVLAQRIHAAAPARPAMGQLPLWTAADGLPAPHRDAYRELLRGQTLSVGQQVREARMARRRAWGGMAAEPFDAAGAAKSLEDARTLEMQARGEVEKKILDFAATLPAAERAQLAQGLARSAPGPRAGMVRRMRAMHGVGPDGPPEP